MRIEAKIKYFLSFAVSFLLCEKGEKREKIKRNPIRQPADHIQSCSFNTSLRNTVLRNTMLRNTVLTQCPSSSQVIHHRVDWMTYDSV